MTYIYIDLYIHKWKYIEIRTICSSKNNCRIQLKKMNHFEPPFRSEIDKYCPAFKVSILREPCGTSVRRKPLTIGFIFVLPLREN